MRYRDVRRTYRTTRKEEKESYLDEKLKKWLSLQPINRAWLERDDSQSSLSELEENKDIDKVLEQLEDNEWSILERSVCNGLWEG